MRTVLASLISKIDANTARLVVFLSLGVSQLLSTLVAFDGVLPPYIVFAIFLGSVSFPFLYKRLYNQNTLKHFQIFYIIPLLVSTTLTYRYGIGEYLLQIVVMVSMGLLCFSEVSKNIDSLSSSVTRYIVAASMVGVFLISALLFNFSYTTKFVTLVSSIVIYMILEVPGEKLLAFRNETLYQKEKNIFFASVIVCVYAIISFTGNVGFWVYFAYVVSAVNLGFSFRNDKVLFLIFLAALLIASLIPFGPREIYIDSFVVSSVVMLFYLKSPILYCKNTEYGEVRVDYSYRSNKVYLLVDGVIQGERILAEDSKSKNLRCFGDASKGSVVYGIFDLLPKDKESNVAVLGLGAGMLSMFGRDKQLINFYEINPEIVKVAYDRRFFDYIGNSKSRTSVILGDARDQLNLAQNKFYDLIFVDVYLGGDIPTHFLTVDAIKMYFLKLKENGAIALHVTSSDSENIELIIAEIAEHLKLTALIAYERYKNSTLPMQGSGLVKIPEQGSIRDKILSGMEYFSNIRLTMNQEEEVYSWVVLSKNKEALKGLLYESKWHPLDRGSGTKLYTDEIIGYKKHKVEITEEVD